MFVSLWQAAASGAALQRLRTQDMDTTPVAPSPAATATAPASATTAPVAAAATATAPAVLPTTTTVEVADDAARGQTEETGEGGEEEEGDIELTRGSDGSPDQPAARIDARAQRTPPAAVAAAAAGSGAGGGGGSGGGFGATPLTGSSSGRTGDTSDLLLGLRDDDSLYFTSDWSSNSRRQVTFGHCSKKVTQWCHRIPLREKSNNPP